MKMKKILYIKTAFLSLASMAVLSSCLKDDAHFVNFAGSKPLVELPAATGVGPGGGFITPIALPISNTPAEVDLLVNVAAPNPLTTALTVKLTIDAAALTAYNNAQEAQYQSDSTAYVAAKAAYIAGGSKGTAPTAPTAPTYYTLMPTTLYTIGSLSVTIPANKYSANLPMMVTTSASVGFDLTKNYVIPFTIIDGGGQQISNYKTVFYNIQGKNQYDGVYSLKGYIHRDADLTLGGPFGSGINVPMITTGPNSVSFTQPWANGVGAGGINPIFVTVTPNAADITNNPVTITSSINASLTNLGTGSHYDAKKGIFYLSFIWNGTDPNVRSTADTLTYTGPRP
jgi:hypothetical protein